MHHCPGLRLPGIFLKTFSVRERADALKKRGLKKVDFRVFKLLTKRMKGGIFVEVNEDKLKQLPPTAQVLIARWVLESPCIREVLGQRMSATQIQKKLHRDKANNRVVAHPECPCDIM